MKIDPDTLAPHLHDAATEQARSTLIRDGYSVEQPKGTGYHPDLVARRGDEVLAFEVKVLGKRSGSKLADASRWAREHGAQLRLLLVRPQREVGIQIERIEELVADALRAAGNDFPTALMGARVQGVEDVDIDAFALRKMDGEVSGSAFALLDAPFQDSEHAMVARAVPLTFKIWFDPGDRSLTRPAHLDWDLSDLDDDA